jgi:putative NADPH-quinone reductase
MRVLVIYCHPVAESFCAAAHARVLKTLRTATQPMPLWLDFYLTGDFHHSVRR